MGKESIKLVANNKKAYHDYFIDDKFEAGIELFGTEAVSYTHLAAGIFGETLWAQPRVPLYERRQVWRQGHHLPAVSYTHLDVYKRQRLHHGRRNYCGVGDIHHLPSDFRRHAHLPDFYP